MCATPILHVGTSPRTSYRVDSIQVRRRCLPPERDASGRHGCRHVYIINEDADPLSRFEVGKLRRCFSDSCLLVVGRDLGGEG